MSRSEDPLAAFLTERLKQEKVRQQQLEAAERLDRERQRREELGQQRREQEHQRRIRILREKERKRREQEQRLVQKLNQEIEEAAAEHRAKQGATYLIYHTSYHQLKEEAEEWIGKFRSQGLSAANPWKLKETYMRIGMQNWPEPYKSKCRFTDLEKTFFLSDPIQAHQVMVLMLKIRT